MVVPGMHRQQMGNNNGRHSPPPRDPLPSFGASCGCAVCRRHQAAEGVRMRPAMFGPEFESAKPVADDAPDSDLYYLVLT